MSDHGNAAGLTEREHDLAQTIQRVIKQRDRALALLRAVNIGQSDEPCCLSGPDGWGEQRYELLAEVGSRDCGATFIGAADVRCDRGIHHDGEHEGRSGHGGTFQIHRWPAS